MRMPPPSFSPPASTQLDTYREVVMTGGMLFVWFAPLDVPGRHQRSAGDDTTRGGGRRSRVRH
jgi:hypothetical protein